jgi:hypothetical protein
MTVFFVTKDEINKLDIYTPLTLVIRPPAANSNKYRVPHYLFIYRLTPALLREFNDITTDLLIDSVK